MPLLGTLGAGSARGFGWGAAASGELSGMVLLTPGSISHTSGSASIQPDGSINFSTISALNINNVFSADYKNYAVVSITSSNIVTYEVAARFRQNGNDATSNYEVQRLEAVGGLLSAARTVGQAYARWGYSGSAYATGNITHIYEPFVSGYTSFETLTAAGSGYFYKIHGTHFTTGSFDGFSLIQAGSGYLSGSLAIYGLLGA